MSYRRHFHESRMFEMANAGGKELESAMNAINIVKAPRKLWLPLFWPKNVTGWFIVLEAQFRNARITSDEMKYNMVIANLQERYMKLVKNIVLNPPATGRYELLKNELIKRLAHLNKGTQRRKRAPPIRASNINKDSVDQVLPSHPSRLTPQVDDPYTILNAVKKCRLFEKEQMGNRTPSQFYKALKSLAFPSTPNDFLLAAWKIRLPIYMQQILAIGNETNPNVVIKIADRIHEITAEASRISTAIRRRN